MLVIFFARSCCTCIRAVGWAIVVAASISVQQKIPESPMVSCWKRVRFMVVVVYLVVIVVLTMAISLPVVNDGEQGKRGWLKKSGQAVKAGNLGKNGESMSEG